MVWMIKLIRPITPHLTSKILSAFGLQVHPNPGLPPRSPSRFLFLAATHDPKTRLTSQGEHAFIRPWLWTLAFDVGSYILC